jgi:hypothetical protein
VLTSRVPVTALQLATPLKEHVAEIHRLRKRVTGDIIKIGKLLYACKDIVGRSEFLLLLEREFGWSEDTAERFIRLYKLSCHIPQIAEYDIALTGLHLLAAPSTPEAVQQQVIERAAIGERFSHAKIKEMIADAKEAAKPRQRLEPQITSAEAPKAAYAAEEQQLDNVADTADFSTPDKPPPESKPESEDAASRGSLADVASRAWCWLLLAQSHDPQLAEHLAAFAAQTDFSVDAAERVIALFENVAVLMRKQVTADPEPSEPAPLAEHEPISDDAHPLDIPPFMRRTS